MPTFICLHVAGSLEPTYVRVGKRKEVAIIPQATPATPTVASLSVPYSHSETHTSMSTAGINTQKLLSSATTHAYTPETGETPVPMAHSTTTLSAGDPKELVAHPTLCMTAAPRQQKDAKAAPRDKAQTVSFDTGSFDI